jgi:hypothetical protein
MFETIGAYIMAFTAMGFAALSAKTLFTAVDHFDPPETTAAPEPVAASSQGAGKSPVAHEAA